MFKATLNLPASADLKFDAAVELARKRVDDTLQGWPVSSL